MDLGNNSSPLSMRSSFIVSSEKVGAGQKPFDVNSLSVIIPSDHSSCNSTIIGDTELLGGNDGHSPLSVTKMVTISKSRYMNLIHLEKHLDEILHTKVRGILEREQEMMKASRRRHHGS
jgi:hypothetical protein